jgi:hypothetical protein
MSDKYDQRTTVVDAVIARKRGEALMAQWDAESSNITADDFATPGENVMIVPASDLKRGDHIVRFTGSPDTHDLRIINAASATVSGRFCITLQVYNEIAPTAQKLATVGVAGGQAFNLLLHPDALVTVERPDWNL